MLVIVCWNPANREKALFDLPIFKLALQKLCAEQRVLMYKGQLPEISMLKRLVTFALCVLPICSTTVTFAQQSQTSVPAPVTVTSSTAASANAQASGNVPAAEFKSESQLVLVPVVVTHNG